MKIEFLKPNINSQDIANMVRSVKSGWLVPGKHTEKFEHCLGEYLGGKTVMLSSCTAALHVSLIMAGIKPGDEVITTPLSWVATSNVILYMGAKVVFADVEPETGLIDPKEVKKHITKKTKAIIVVHTYGQMADMVELKRIAGKIRIIEDSAHSLEAKRDGFYPGQLGYAACFSFHAAKNITSGNGGAILVHDPARAKLIRRHGVANLHGKRVMLELGYKYEPTDFQAALLVGQLSRIESSHAKREEVFKRYREAFEGKLNFPKQVPNSTHACHMFIIWVDPKKRDLIREQLLELGIETSIHYPPIHLEPYYKKLGFRKGSFPIAERLGASTITLPTYALTRKQQDYIVKGVLSCVSR